MSSLAPTFEMALQPAVKSGARLRLNTGTGTGTGPVTIGLQMANWLVLMVLMSGFMLAATMTDRSEPAGSSAETGSVAPR